MSESHAPLPNGSDLKDRFAVITQRLSASPPPDAQARAEIKQEIIGLFRDAALAAAHYAAFKDAVKALASQWKIAEASEAGELGESLMPTPTTAAPQVKVKSQLTGRVDHLGASTFVEKGWSKLSVGDATGAEIALRRALELAPRDNDAECLLGWALMSQQRYDAAMALFERVLARDPHHALARTNVGYVCMRRKEYGDAIEHLSNAIRSNRDRKATLYAHLYLGTVYREREMYDDALLFYRRALELGPNLLEAWYEMGRACWYAGRQDEAREAWRHGADANKFNPWGKRCAELLVHMEQGGAPPSRD